MIEDAMHKALERELSKYGRDMQNNYVLSEESLKTVASKLIKAADAAIERPIITTTYRDVVELCKSAGFVVDQKLENNIRIERIYDKTRTVEVYQEVQNLVDSTVQMVLKRVNELTRVEKE